MKKVSEAQQILKALGLEVPQQNEISALTLLALADVGPKTKWTDAKTRSMTISNDIMAYVNTVYKKTYAPNSRETFRRKVLHQFTQAGVTVYNPDAPNAPVNYPKAHYALTGEALKVIRSYGATSFKKNSETFIKGLHARLAKYQKARDFEKIPLKLDDGREFLLSPGAHNEVEVAVVKEFGPRFAKGAALLYLGDTENKEIIFEKTRLKKLGCEIKDHGKLPDVILYEPKNEWLYLIEAVTSHGPISQKRVNELKEIFPGNKLIFVTAFPDLTEFKKHAKEIAWDTEVWIAEVPDHMIHFNGDRFVGPR